MQVSQAPVDVEERKNGRVPNIIGNREDGGDDENEDEDAPVRDAQTMQRRMPTRKQLKAKSALMRNAIADTSAAL